MLLVILGIVWVAVLVYWFQTRNAGGGSLFDGLSDRMGSLEQSLGRARSARRGGDVVPLSFGTAVPPHPGHRPHGAARRPSRPVAPRARPMAPSYGHSPIRAGATSAQARVRRRNVLFGLSGACFVTFLMGFTAGGNFMLLFYAALGALVVYVCMLLEYQRQVDAARQSPLRVDPPLIHDSSLIVQPDPLLGAGDGSLDRAGGFLESVVGGNPRRVGEVVDIPTASHTPAFDELPAALGATGTDGPQRPTDDIWSSGGGLH